MDRKNYASAEGKEAEILKLFREEAAYGWMQELDDDVAMQRYGGTLHVGSLGAVEEKDKVRVVHDGSHGVQINHRIRIRDQVRYPGAAELETLLKERRYLGKKGFAVIGDAHKAHRRIKIRSSDWGYMACRVCPGKVWINTVGTYGFSSAGYYWSRLAGAVMVRLPHYLIGQRWRPEILLYADDWFGIAGRKGEMVDLGGILLLFEALGVPMKWKKYRGGFEAVWVGYEIGLDLWTLGISAARAAWVTRWIGQILETELVDLADLCAVTGRLSFAMGPLYHLRPFLAPIYSWSAAVGRRGTVTIPWSMAFILGTVSKMLEGEGRYIQMPVSVRALGEAFRADAKAQGQTVILGGWECLGGARPGEARWFSVRLDRKNAPWAFAKGEPFRVVAALELYATLVSVMVFGDRWPAGASGQVTIGGTTDNGGNPQILSRLMTSKFPLVVVLAELAEQLRSRGWRLDLQWAPRDQNEEADDLTNEEFGRFDLARRIPVEVGALPWLVMETYMRNAEALYGEIVEAKRKRAEAQEQSGEGMGKKPRPLRERDPW